MKLLKCHITGFGCLKNIDYSFTNNINQYFLNNGEGKSTLAVFIKVMFYGMETVTGKKTEELSERLHYIPFFESKYGGNITFEFDEKVYRIEREFDKKSVARDEIIIYNDKGQMIDKLNGQPVDKNFLVGDYFLGIDKNGFLKANFIYSEDLDFEINESIKNKIGNIVLDTNSDYYFDDVMKSINEDLKKNKLNSKNYGSTNLDKIDIAERSNEELKKKISIIDTEKETLKDYYDEYKKKIEKQRSLEEKINYLCQKELEEKDWEYVYLNEEKINQNLVELKKIEDKYSKGLPSNSSIQKLNELDIKYYSELANLEEYKLSDTEKDFLEDYRLKYNNEEITSTLIDELTKKQGIIESYQERTKIKPTYDITELNKYKSIFNVEYVKDRSWVEKEYDSIQIIKNQFGEEDDTLKSIKYPSKEDISFVSDKIAISKNKEMELLEIKKKYENKPSIKSIILFIVTISIYFFIWKKNQKRIRTIIVNLTNEISELINEINEIFASFNIEGDNNDVKLMYLINLKKQNNSNNTKKQDELIKRITTLNDYLSLFVAGENYEDRYNEYISLNNAYESLLIKEEEYKNIIDEAKGSIIKEENESDKLLKDFKFDVFSLSEKIAVLKNDKNRFDTIIKKQNKYNTCQESFDKIKNKISEILAEFGLFIETDYKSQKKALIEDNEEYKALKANIESMKANILNFKSQKNLTVHETINIAEKMSIAKKSLELLKNEIKSYNMAIYEKEINIGNEDYYREQIKDNLALIEMLKHKNDIIEKTRVYLINAMNSLEERFLLPIKDKFTKYAKLINEKIGLNFLMDNNYCIKYDIDGKYVSSKHLSDGEKTILNIALRFAIIDQLYKENDIFIILDDPLVYLDENNLEKAKKVIEEIAKEKQIIYFTCHNTRKIIC